MTTPAEKFARLQVEHAKAVGSARDRIQQWEGFMNDYEALEARLRSLPDRLSHDVMVPFGKFAFMPGQLQHTNEIMVLLGDNWFAKCSAKQAIAIAERRKEYVGKMLGNEKMQYSDLKARFAFTEDFSSTAKEHEGTVEIREELTAEEAASSEQRLRRKARTAPVRDSGGSARVKGQRTTDQMLWARLNELEREEEEFLKKEERAAVREGQPGGSPVPCGEEVEGGAHQQRAEPLVITFSHSQLEGQTAVEEHEGVRFSSPGDISRHPPRDDSEPEESVSRGKTVRWSPALVQANPGATLAAPQLQSLSHQSALPFTGRVLERTAPSSAAQEPERKVSKFKASRKQY